MHSNVWNESLVVDRDPHSYLNPPPWIWDLKWIVNYEQGPPFLSESESETSEINYLLTETPTSTESPPHSSLNMRFKMNYLSLTGNPIPLWFWKWNELFVDRDPHVYLNLEFEMNYVLTWTPIPGLTLGFLILIKIESWLPFGLLSPIRSKIWNFCLTPLGFLTPMLTLFECHSHLNWNP